MRQVIFFSGLFRGYLGKNGGGMSDKMGGFGSRNGGDFRENSDLGLSVEIGH